MCYRVGRGDKQLFKLFMAASKKVDKIAEIKQELQFFFFMCQGVKMGMPILLLSKIGLYLSGLVF